MEIVEPMKPVASLHSTAVTAAGVAMEAAAMSVKLVILRKRRTTGSARHQRDYRKP